MFHQYQPPQNTPVSAREVQVQMFQGLPNQIPFVPNIQVDPNFQQFLPMVVGLYMKELQDNHARNPSRMFALNLNGQNGWQNQTFFEALQGILEYAEFLCATTRQAPNITVPTAVREYCRLMAGMYISQYPDLQQGLTQQQGFEVQQIIQQLQVLDQNIKGYLAQKQQGQQMQQTMYGQQNTFGASNAYLQTNHNPYAPQQQQGQVWNGARMNPSHLAVPSTVMSQTPLVGSPTPAGTPSGRGGLGPRRQGGSGIIQEFGENAQGQAAIQTNQAYVHAVPPTPIEGKIAVNTPIGQPHPTPAPAVPAAPEPQYTHITDNGIGVISHNAERPYDDVTLDNGVRMQPAVLSEWTPTFSLDHPYSELYDPTTHVKFLVADIQGTVREAVMEMKPDMEYINHELNRKRNTTTALAGDVVRTEPHWSSIEKMTALTTANPEDAAADQDITLTDKPLLLPNVLQAHSFTEAEILFRSEMGARGMDLLPSVPAEYHYNHLLPIYTGTNRLEAVQRLASSESLVILAERLAEQFNQGETYWYTLNQLLTDHLNEVLEINLQLVGWAVESFVDDLKELYTALAETYSDSLIDKLELAARKIIAGSVDALYGEAFREYFAKMPENKDLLEGTLVLSQRVSVTTLNWRLSDFVGHITEVPVMVKESTMPVFYGALSALVKRTAGFRHRYLLTLDRQVVEVHEGYLGKNVHLIRKVSVR